MNDDFDLTSQTTFHGVRTGTIGPDLLVEQYLPRLRAYVRVRLGPKLGRHEAESDIVQSVCREICEDAEVRDFGAEPEFRAWLFTTAANKIREKARHWGREKRTPARVEALGADWRPDELQAMSQLTPSGVVSSREEIHRVEAAMRRLPDDYREVIALSRLAGLPHDAVAKKLGRTTLATRKLLGRALLRLSELLDSPTP